MKTLDDLTSAQFDALMSVRDALDDIRSVEAKMAVVQAALDVKIAVALQTGVPARMLAQEIGRGIMAVYQARDRAT